MLVCKNHFLCVRPSEVCNGVVHCPYGDDESLCGINQCSSICVCLALGMIYHFILNSSNTYFFKEMIFIWTSIHFVNIRHCNISFSIPNYPLHSYNIDT